MERISMMEALVATQNQPPPPPQTLFQRIVIYEITSTLIYVAPQHHMPPGFPWGMPLNFVPGGYQPAVEIPVAQPIMYVSPLVVHATPYV